MIRLFLFGLTVVMVLGGFALGNPNYLTKLNGDNGSVEITNKGKDTVMEITLFAYYEGSEDKPKKLSENLVPNGLKTGQRVVAEIPLDRKYKGLFAKVKWDSKCQTEIDLDIVDFMFESGTWIEITEKTCD